MGLMNFAKNAMRKIRGGVTDMTGGGSSTSGSTVGNVPAGRILAVVLLWLVIL